MEPYAAIARFWDRGPDRPTLTVVMHLVAFFDESGKWHDSDFVCLCGYLFGDDAEPAKDRALAFAVAWRALLEKHGFDAIHVAKFYAQCHKRGWDQERADAVLMEFCDAIRQHALVGFAIGFDAKAWRSLPDAQRKRIDDPARFCILRALRIMRNRLADEGHPGRLGLFFDEDEDYAVKCYRIISGLRRRQPEVREMINSITFAPDENFYPLQAADILANLSNKYLRQKALTGKDEMGPVLTRLLVHPDSGRGHDLVQELWDVAPAGGPGTHSVMGFLPRKKG